jgi:hypothetical protein
VNTASRVEPSHTATGPVHAISMSRHSGWSTSRQVAATACRYSGRTQKSLQSTSPSACVCTRRHIAVSAADPPGATHDTGPPSATAGSVWSVTSGRRSYRRPFSGATSGPWLSTHRPSAPHGGPSARSSDASSAPHGARHAGLISQSLIAPPSPSACTVLPDTDTGASCPHHGRSWMPPAVAGVAEPHLVRDGRAPGGDAGSAARAYGVIKGAGPAAGVPRVAMARAIVLPGAGGRAGGVTGACVMGGAGGCWAAGIRARGGAAPRKPIHIARLSCGAHKRW